MFTIEVADQAVQDALQQLAQRVQNPQPVLQLIGEGIMERTKERFATSSGPDGQRWQANAQSTITAYLARKGGFGKKGITQKGQALAMSKKPLIGLSGDLRREFHVNAVVNAVTIGNTMKYAAMQQFGGTKAAFHQLWGDIPARPFLPVTQSGDLYPAERSIILDALHAYLEGA